MDFLTNPQIHIVDRTLPGIRLVLFCMYIVYWGTTPCKHNNMKRNEPPDDNIVLSTARPSKRHQNAAVDAARLGMIRSPKGWNTLRKTWNANAICLNLCESLMFELDTRIVGTADSECEIRMASASELRMQRTNYIANERIMPYMQNGDGGTGCTLSVDVLFDLYQDDGGRKIQNFLLLVACMGVKERILGGDRAKAKNLFFAEAGSDAACPDSNLAAMILIACGPTLKVALTGSGKIHIDTLLGLQTITADQQATALAFITTYWQEKDNRLAQWHATRPLYGTDCWWTFVNHFMRITMGFIIQKTAGSLDAPAQYRLTTGEFWKVHGIDAVQVGLAHRQLGDKPRTVPILRHGRPYGVLPKRMRQCMKCTATNAHRGPQWCVRQNGDEWLCTRPDMCTLPWSAVGHRDYNTPIDTGYLDELQEPVTNAERDEEEDVAPAEEKESAPVAATAATATAIDQSLTRIPLAFRQLLQALDFTPSEMYIVYP
jgi:hypothetical protein